MWARTVGGRCLRIRKRKRRRRTKRKRRKKKRSKGKEEVWWRRERGTGEWMAIVRRKLDYDAELHEGRK